MQRPAYIVSLIPCWWAQHDCNSQDPCHPLRRRPGLSDSANLLLRRLFILSVQTPCLEIIQYRKATTPLIHPRSLIERR